MTFINLRDALREKNMHHSAVDEVITLLLQNHSIVVGPEDYIDFVLNIGNRHRRIEKYDIRYGQRYEGMAETHYPETIFGYTLAERIVSREFTGDYSSRMKAILRQGYDLEETTKNYRSEVAEICSYLESEDNVPKTINLAQQFANLRATVKEARKLIEDLTTIARERKRGIETILGGKRIHFAPGEISPGWTKEYGLLFGVLSTVLHNTPYSLIGLNAFSQSPTFKQHYGESLK